MCQRCKGEGWVFVVCYSLGVIACPKCGDPNDKPGKTFQWWYDDKGKIVVHKSPFKGGDTPLPVLNT